MRQKEEGSQRNGTERRLRMITIMITLTVKLQVMVLMLEHMNVMT